MSALDDARAEVERLAKTDEDPTLSPEEVEAILAKHLRAEPWAASTAVTYGQVRLPTVRMGKRFKAVQGGTTGTTEPVWGSTDYARYSDGTVIWQEDGGDWDNPYNLRAALYEALDVRVQKSVNQNQYINDGRGQASSYLYLNLVRERDKYKAVGVA